MNNSQASTIKFTHSLLVNNAIRAIIVLKNKAPRCHKDDQVVDLQGMLIYNHPRRQNFKKLDKAPRCCLSSSQTLNAIIEFKKQYLQIQKI
ncbi:hypothetical protein MEO93_26500 [Dolichospermum sp. ST_sed3]|nr:hypothetical protein [Dolichospermum sp. ST_sed3]